MPVLTDLQLATFTFGRAFSFNIPESSSIGAALKDLTEVVGDGLIVGGIAVIHHGYERTTTGIDVLYAYRDASILTRLSPHFNVIKKPASGWHHLEHKRTGVRLELIPEGGLTTYGFIPGPYIVGGQGGVVSLLGLVWLKLVSGRSQDDADIVSLAKIRLEEMKGLAGQLPAELHDRYLSHLQRAEQELSSDPSGDPNAPAPDPSVVQEMMEKYGPKEPKK